MELQLDHITLSALPCSVQHCVAFNNRIKLNQNNSYQSSDYILSGRLAQMRNR